MGQNGAGMGGASGASDGGGGGGGGGDGVGLAASAGAAATTAAPAAVMARTITLARNNGFFMMSPLLFPLEHRSTDSCPRPKAGARIVKNRSFSDSPSRTRTGKALLQRGFSWNG